MRRISVVGNSGSGKTTLARKLAAALAIPHLELDSVFHQPGWQELDTEVFRERMTAFTAGPGWVVDGNYSAVRDIVWSQADTVVLTRPSRSSPGPGLPTTSTGRDTPRPRLTLRTAT